VYHYGHDHRRGCTSTRVQCHHLIHWVDGGPTDTWNLCCLCPFHHDGHHGGEFTITGNADDPAGLTFTTRHGSPIRPGPTFTTPTNPPPPGSSGSPPLTTAYGGPTGESLDLRWVTFHEPRAPAYR
jgi:hypothetical protein